MNHGLMGFAPCLHGPKDFGVAWTAVCDDEVLHSVGMGGPWHSQMLKRIAPTEWPPFLADQHTETSRAVFFHCTAIDFINRPKFDPMTLSGEPLLAIHVGQFCIGWRPVFWI